MLFRLKSFGLPRSLPAATRSLSSPTQHSVVHQPYFVPRNSNGSLPVYTDIRNGGTRFLLTIRNIDGNITVIGFVRYRSSLRTDQTLWKAFAKEFSDGLFPPGSPEASRLKVSVSRSKHLIIQGGTGRWKHNIIDWLLQKGFWKQLTYVYDSLIAYRRCGALPCPFGVESLSRYRPV